MELGDRDPVVDDLLAHLDFSEDRDLDVVAPPTWDSMEALFNADLIRTRRIDADEEEIPSS